MLEAPIGACSPAYGCANIVNGLLERFGIADPTEVDVATLAVGRSLDADPTPLARMPRVRVRKPLDPCT